MNDNVAHQLQRALAPGLLVFCLAWISHAESQGPLMSQFGHEAGRYLGACAAFVDIKPSCELPRGYIFKSVSECLEKAALLSPVAWKNRLAADLRTFLSDASFNQVRKDLLTKFNALSRKQGILSACQFSIGFYSSSLVDSESRMKIIQRQVDN